MVATMPLPQRSRWLGFEALPSHVAQPMLQPSLNQTQVCATSHGDVPFTQAQLQHVCCVLLSCRGPPAAGCAQLALCGSVPGPHAAPRHGQSVRSTAFREIGEMRLECAAHSSRPTAAAASS